MDPKRVSLLELPPEILLHTLSYLPISSLLPFSTTSRYTHSLASRSLHTLSLGIYTSRSASLIGRLENSTSRLWQSSSTKRLPSSIHEASPYAISVIVPSANEYNPKIIDLFQIGLATNVLQRYAVGLRHLEMRIWAFDTNIAKALAGLRGLRSLVLRIDFPYGVGKRRLSPSLRRVKDKAWDGVEGAWGCLVLLELDGCDLNAVQLKTILEANTLITQLAIQRCPQIDNALFNYLQRWPGRRNLKELAIEDCPSIEGEKDLEEAISAMGQLEHLSFCDCYGIDPKVLREKNEESWHIKKLVLTRSRDSIGNPGPIEVDPDYLSEE
ncbi:hypothetical protein M501DRAFT_986049 [Patellaria atrata CBS 101060]|uniref:F-box domain-containing protein n=1 Tax=Patellaria atrata CBS 101060 TaxID=1346257 RepID=A0A9P4VNK9_9PEZI|nr:hypothetical protein M501DRAFT_986049 [Patellaria atrata CBS 101060]